MNDKEVLKKAAATILEKREKVRVNYQNHSWLMRIGLMKPYREFEIKPLNMAKMIRISELLLGLEVDFGDNDKMLESIFKLIKENGDNLVKMAAVALSKSNRADAQDTLIDFLSLNMTSPQLLAITMAAVSQLNLNDFLSTIVSVRGLNVLKASPNEQGS